MKLHSNIILVILHLTLSYQLVAGCPIPGYSLVECLKEQIQAHKVPKKSDYEPLSFCEFQKLRNSGALPSEDADDLIEFAYHSGNPVLFKGAETQVLPTEYSLNFLWIHKETLVIVGHLMGNDDQRFRNNVLNPIFDWQSKQPEAQINFWVDSAMIKSYELVLNQSKQILSDNGLDLTKIEFKDIRDIELVKEHDYAFEASIPVYFRVDLAKAIIGDHILGQLPYVVNIHSDIVAVTRQQLFDKKTIHELDNVGYVFGTAGGAEEENSFIILHSDNNLKTKENHLAIIIERGLLKAKNKPLKQDVFSNYVDFKSKMKLEFKTRSKKAWKQYDSAGKPMIFPASQFGQIGGYSEPLLSLLKQALITIRGCE